MWLRLAASRADKISCTAPHTGTVADLGQVAVIECKLKDSDVAYRVYEVRKGRLLYEAEGLMKARHVDAPFSLADYEQMVGDPSLIRLRKSRS